ncbi:MAG: universal stress protein [Syntrophobacterales bacterium]|jgi:nucleotide-binding universal stress UspA family protein
MAVKLLIGLDKSAGAWRAVEYVAKSYAQTPGVEVTLLHILGGLPPAFWDDGHILSEKERENRQRLIDNWQADKEKEWQGLVNKATDLLKSAGIHTVTSKFTPKYYDEAEDIVNEAVEGGYSTIVMGRRGLGSAKSLLLGSVTHKVVQNSRGRAVIVVE